MRLRALLMTVLGLTTASAAAVPACRSTSLPVAPGAVDTPVVARVGETPIHAADLAAQMRRTKLDGRRALEQLLTFELLAKAAADHGAAGDADTADQADALRSAKVQRLVEREIEPRIALGAIPDSEVRALYERAKGRFVHGRLVQIGVLCLFTGARMKPEPRARIAEAARKLNEFVARRTARDSGDFETVARDPFWSARNVTFTTVWQGDDTPFPAAVGAAVKKLARPGDTTDLLSDETGYYIARYIAERPPENVSFAEAAPRIRAEMYEPWRRRQFLQLTLTMAQSHDIQIFPENFPQMTEARK